MKRFIFTSSLLLELLFLLNATIAAESPPTPARSQESSTILKISQFCTNTKSTKAEDDDKCLHKAVSALLATESEGELALDLENRTLKLLHPIPIFGVGSKLIFNGTLDCESFVNTGEPAFKLLSMEKECPTETAADGTTQLANFCVTSKEFKDLTIRGHQRCDGFHMNGRYYDIFLRRVKIENPASYGLLDSYRLDLKNPDDSIYHSGHCLHISRCQFVSDEAGNATAIKVGSGDSLIIENSFSGFKTGAVLGRPEQFIHNSIRLDSSNNSNTGSVDAGLEITGAGVYADNSIEGGIVRVPEHGQFSIGVFVQNSITAPVNDTSPGFIEVAHDSSDRDNVPVFHNSMLNSNRFTSSPAYASASVVYDATGQFAQLGRFGGTFIRKNEIDGANAPQYPNWRYLTPVNAIVAPSAAAKKEQSSPPGGTVGSVSNVVYADTSRNASPMTMNCAPKNVDFLSWGKPDGQPFSEPEPTWNMVGLAESGNLTIRVDQPTDSTSLGSFSSRFDCDDRVAGEISMPSGTTSIAGYACVFGDGAALSYLVYAGGPLGAGQFVLGGEANLTPEAAGLDGGVGATDSIMNDCGLSADQSLKLGLSLDLTNQAFQSYRGQNLYVYAILPLTGLPVPLPGSGTYIVP